MSLDGPVCADCMLLKQYCSCELDELEEDGPMDLEDQLEVALDKAFPPTAGGES